MWLTKKLEHLEEKSKLHLIHGDFCFNNILCDPLYTTVKLIDPRGESAPRNNYPPGYGDSRYDLVKLFHSIGGHYDSIVNDLFRLRWQSSKDLEFEVYVPSHQPFLAKTFQVVLMKDVKTRRTKFANRKSVFQHATSPLRRSRATTSTSS